MRQIVGAIDLVLSCGDLPNYYIDYVASMLGVRLPDGPRQPGASSQFIDPWGLDGAPPRHPMDMEHLPASYTKRGCCWPGWMAPFADRDPPIAASNTPRTRCGAERCD